MSDLISEALYDYETVIHGAMRSPFTDGPRPGDKAFTK